MINKHEFSECDTCTKFITSAIQQAGWQQHQFREEVNPTDGRVMVRSKLAARVRNAEAKGGPKRAVECKGADRWNAAEDDRSIGGPWAKMSEDRCRFVMVKDKRWDSIEEKLE